MSPGKTHRYKLEFCFFCAALAVWALYHGSGQDRYLAYIGPGAGIAFLGSFLALIGGAILGLLSILLWPFRLLWRAIAGRQGYQRAKVRKVILLGLDGLDPQLLERFMAAGKLPNFAKLSSRGDFRRLRTTFPALSPVAWSTFATGVNPGRHRMFDFLNRSLQSYMPELSSSRVRGAGRVLSLGKYRIPLSRPWVEARRGSRAFWQILSDHRISSTILRVPITFPPEEFNGRMLSAMCTPDLLGSQGTFTWFTTRPDGARLESGMQFPLSPVNGGYEGMIRGPKNSFVADEGDLELPFSLRMRGTGRFTLAIGNDRHDLAPDEFTPWIPLTFRPVLGISVRGMARFLLRVNSPEISLYMTPINIDPEHPALPISHPGCYAAYLAKLLGPYSTLGMAEDTWAMNEGALDERAFLQQAYLVFEERKAMFASALERMDRGVVACVFDTTDRVQHMFFRHMNRGGPYAGVIEDLYCRADALVGKTLESIDRETVLFVLSDHGFASFERGVNLNTWLLANGYLALKNDENGGREYLQDVDWSRTKAYTFGLAGIYINLRGREAQGIVKPSDAPALRQELAAKLSGLYDVERGQAAIRAAWACDAVYRGPYVEAAPDVIVGYEAGYRASWDAALGKISSHTIENNQKAWSGDHCVDPHLVPGVLLANRAIAAADPGIEDMAPTVLDLFGIQPPPYMEGKSILDFSLESVASEAAA